MFYAAFKNRAHFILDLLQFRPPPVEGVLLSRGRHPSPWQLSLGRQWKGKLHLRFPPPGSCLRLNSISQKAFQMLTPPQMMTTPQAILSYARKRNTWFRVLRVLSLSRHVPPSSHNAPDHLGAPHSLNVGIFDSV